MDKSLPTTLLDYANIVSIKALCGMIGALLLIAAMPPRREQGGLDFNEILQRGFAGAFLPVFMGPWLQDLLQSEFTRSKLHQYPQFIYMLLGVMSYFVFRWLAIWLTANKDKNVIQNQLRRRWEDTTERPTNNVIYAGEERRKRKAEPVNLRSRQK